MKNEEFTKNNNIEIPNVVKGYEDGSAARVIEEAGFYSTEPIRIPREHEIKRYEVEPEYEQSLQPRTGRTVDLFFAAVLAIAIMVTLYICINYLQIRSDIVKLEKQISSIEKNISTVEKENIALERTVNSEGCDLDYVYNIAVGVLGMVYPDNNEVLYYQNNGSSYYRDYASR